MKVRGYGRLFTEQIINFKQLNMFKDSIFKYKYGSLVTEEHVS